MKSQLSRELSLNLILIVPFLMLMVIAVGLTGFLSLRNGQKAINELAGQLRSEVSARITQRLDSYMAVPLILSQNNQEAINLGILDISDSEQLGRYFWQQVKAAKVSYVIFGKESGEHLAAGHFFGDDRMTIDEVNPEKHQNYHLHIYDTDVNGNRTQVIRDSGNMLINGLFPLQQEGWYAEAIEQQGPVWTPVYNWEVAPFPLSIATSRPVYDQNKTLIGVVAVEQQLSQMSDFFQSLQVSPSGKAFVIEPSGLLVASSSDERPFTIKNDKPVRLKSTDSQDPLIQATSNYLIEHFGDLNQIKDIHQLDFWLGHQHQFVQVMPWQDPLGLEWLVVVTVPESDFMDQINANTRSTILLCLGALTLALMLSIYTSRWIAKPLQKLSHASAAIASGDLEQTVQVRGIKEFSGLGRSFNQMAKQLQSSFAALAKSNEELEQRVEERTTELKSAKDNADAANKAKSDFLANMSHELRTPLNGVLGYAQILERDKTLTPKQLDQIKVIHQCGSHLLILINDILDLAKVEANKLELYPTEFNFANFLLGVRDMCRIRAEQKEIDFNFQELNRLPSAVCTDEKRLRQVLINLLGNAVKFTSEGGIIFSVGIMHHSPETNLVDGQRELNKLGSKDTSFDVHHQTTALKIRFQVEDSGIGMTPEQQDRIFLPFEQVSDPSLQLEGAGLGLTISRKIVNMMGSEIQLKSTAGLGSKFWFDLELTEVGEFQNSKNTHPTHNISGYQGKRRTILIVDDRWENRSVIMNLLGSIGFQMHEAVNGQEGIEQITATKPDLIITDLKMPVMDGFQMTKAVRALKDFHEIVIIASSASVFSFDRQQSYDAGCNDFLAKPVQVSELLDQLQQYLGLTWIYDTQTKVSPELSQASQGDSSQTTMIYPPREELIELYQSAKVGYILGIQAEAHRLKQLNSDYDIFANKILQLAERFEDEAIVVLISPMFNESSL